MRFNLVRHQEVKWMRCRTTFYKKVLKKFLFKLNAKFCFTWQCFFNPTGTLRKLFYISIEMQQKANPQYR